MFDRAALRAALDRHGPVARIVVAATEGSAPREAGAAMLVWRDGQSGTIGGGALEFEAVALARSGLGGTGATRTRRALGPMLQQCCGGRVTLVTEHFAIASDLPNPQAGVVARPAGPHAAPEPPLAVRRILGRARREGVMPAPVLVQGWLVEPEAAPSRAVWIWGAGHVGRALVAVLDPLPNFALTWVDIARDRFPDEIAPGVTCRMAADPVDAVAAAPKDAEHLVLTFSHPLDLALCDALLRHGFARLGLIGSATKRARFRARLAALGHQPAALDRIQCPIGDPALGKHPQAIAIGVAMSLLAPALALASDAERRA